MDAAAPAAPAVTVAATAVSALPLPEPVLVVALAVLLLLHLVAASVGVGAALLTLVYELRGAFRRDLDALAQTIAQLTVPALGVAVALGTGPLILVKLLHPLALTGATALAGPFWIIVLVLTAAAALLAALHRRSWAALAAHKGLHIALITASCLLMLTLTLLIIAVANLMLVPGLWRQVEHLGFASALTLPGVLPHALVFVLAALTVTGLVLVRMAARACCVIDGVSADEVKGHGYAIALGAGSLLLLAGLLALITLPAPGISGRLVVAGAAALLFALPALWWMWCELSRPTPGAGVRHGSICGSFALTLLFLITGSLVHRHEAFTSPQEQQRQQGEWFEARVMPARILDALAKAQSGGGAKPATDTAKPTASAADLALGDAVYKKSCFLCHDVATRKIGPPLLEVAPLYAGNPDGIVAWAKKPAPVAKRASAGYPPMLPIVLPDNELKAVAQWILALPGQQKK